VGGTGGGERIIPLSSTRGFSGYSAGAQASRAGRGARLARLREAPGGYVNQQPVGAELENQKLDIKANSLTGLIISFKKGAE